MNTVIYARYSAGPRQTDQSIEGQLRVCTDFCKQRGLTVIDTYCDRHISGRTDERPEFQRLIADAKRKKFEAVVVYKTDRFARNKYDSAVYKRELKRNGIQIFYAAEAIPDGPEGIILESLMEGLAEYYSAELAQKIKRGMHESALKCQSTGSGRPLGYRVDEQKHFQIDPESAQTVQTIFEQYIKGESNAAICELLNSRGLRTAQGKPFNKNSINRIIKNRKYIGEYRYHDIVVEGGMPAIISKDTFNLAQAEMERRRTRKAPKSPKAEYLLAGRLFCGHCKGPMQGVSGTGKSGNKWYYYYCGNTRGKNKTCDKKQVSLDRLERAVVDFTVRYILQEEVLEELARKVHAAQERQNDTASEIAFYEKKLADNKKSIANVLRAIESGAATQTLPARLQELENEQAVILGELSFLKGKCLAFTEDQILFALTKHLEPYPGESEQDYRRRIISDFVSEVYLYDDRLLIYFNISSEDGKLKSADLSNIEGGEFDEGLVSSTISLAVILVKLRRAFCVDTLMFELDREVYCMKKVLSVSIKTIIFFVGWAICVSVIPIPDTASAVIWRFWAELIPLLSVIAITLIFWLADQKKIRLHLTGKPVYNIILGGVTGTIWLGASVGILSILGVVQIEGKNQIAMLWLWLLAAFLNTVMQEMLVRGYLYQMIKSNGSIAAAIIVSTGLFTFAHGGAFEAGILPVLNVITMSLFMTAVLEYTGSLIAPIVIHFLWNGVGAIILGGVSLAEDYPHLFDMTIHGNPILSGGSCKIEGSIIVLFMNLAFLIGFVAAKKRKDRNR